MADLCREGFTCIKTRPNGDSDEEERRFGGIRREEEEEVEEMKKSERGKSGGLLITPAKHKTTNASPARPSDDGHVPPLFFFQLHIRCSFRSREFHLNPTLSISTER